MHNWRTMNTQLLNYAIEIERCGSITKAAQNLFMAQPNLSKALRELEDQLGFEIFDRTTAGMCPTAEGTCFLSHARTILEQLDEISEIGNTQSKNYTKFLVSIPRGSYIASGCADFVAQLPDEDGMSITIQETNSMQAIHNVAHEKFQLGIIRYQDMYKKNFLDYLAAKHVKHEVVWTFEAVVVMSDKHPLANKPHVEMEDLSPYIEISHGDADIPYITPNHAEHLLHTISNKHIYIYERGNQFELLSKLPTSFVWASPLPENYLKKYNLVQRKCSMPQNLYHDSLIYRDGYRFTELDIQFQRKLFQSRIDVASKYYV